MSNCEDVCETALVPEFALRRFEAAGISGMAVRVAQGEQLTDEDIQRLVEASLPVLAKLVSLKPDYRPCDCPAVDPVVYLPFAEWSKSAGREVAIERGTANVHEAARQLVELIEQDARVREFGDCVRTLQVAIDTGEDLLGDVFKAVADDFAEDPQHAGVSVALAAYLHHEPVDESQAANTMRAIAFARLTSADSEIRAPVGRLGIKAAHVALSFGATHLGEVALNPETAAALQIPTLAELADALRYDSPTDT